MKRNKGNMRNNDTYEYVAFYFMKAFPSIVTLIVLYVKLQIDYVNKFSDAQIASAINTVFVYRGVFWLIIINTLIFGVFNPLILGVIRNGKKLLVAFCSVAFVCLFFVFVLPFVNHKCDRIMNRIFHEIQQKRSN